MKPFFQKRKKFILAVALVIIVASLNFYKKEVKNLFYTASLPVQNFFWNLGKKTAGFFDMISNIGQLKKGNEELNLKNQELISEINSLKEAQKENETLREALGLGLEKEFELKMAKVISKDLSVDLIEINKGSRDGILENQPVITSQKVLVGKVNTVYENFSKVMLISDKQSSFDAEISGKDISGLVKGQGSSKFSLELIPREKEISKDEVVVTSILGGVFPEGLLVGKIGEIRKTDIDPFQSTEIQPFFNINDLETLFVITKF
jgi:rod shape-determining protein MreC